MRYYALYITAWGVTCDYIGSYDNIIKATQDANNQFKGNLKLLLSEADARSLLGSLHVALTEPDIKK